MHRTRLAILAFNVVALGGCASVHIYKATDSGIAPDGTRDDGIPFYLPRPYVQVFEPFVVKADSYLVTGRVSDDGEFLLLEAVPEDLAKVVSVTRGEVRQPAIRVSSIREPSPSGIDPGKGNLQSSDEAVPPAASASAASAPSEAASGAGKAESAAKPADTASEPKSGKSSLSVKQAATAFLPTFGRRFFDVVWLPDWDEKYIIKSSPGLGNSKVGVTMTQGWGLYGLDAELDNEAIVKPLLQFYSGSLSALGKLAQSKIFPAGALQSADVSSDNKGAKAKPAAGQQVTVKVTKVSVAAPGLYPILKPKEAGSAETIPAGAIAAKVLVPARPFTNVAFNIYDVVVVEATKPFGDSPMNLQRYFDVQGGTNTSESNGADSSRGADRSDAIKFDRDSFIQKVNPDLKALSESGEGVWVVKDAKATAFQLEVTVELQGEPAPAKLPDKNSTKTVLKKHSQPFNNVNSIVVK